MSQGDVMIVTEESQDYAPTSFAWARAMRGARLARIRRVNVPPAFSEKNDSQPSATTRHYAPLRATKNLPASHAHSVFLTTELPSVNGQQMRLRRVELGLTQPELAKEAGVGRRTIQRIEETGITPRPLTAHKIERTLERLERAREEGAEHGNDRSKGDGS